MEKISLEDLQAFCAHVNCPRSHRLTELMSIENPPNQITREISAIQEKCKYNCNHSAREFYDFLASSNYPIKSLSS